MSYDESATPLDHTYGQVLSQTCRPSGGIHVAHLRCIMNPPMPDILPDEYHLRAMSMVPLYLYSALVRACCMSDGWSLESVAH